MHKFIRAYDDQPTILVPGDRKRILSTISELTPGLDPGRRVSTCRIPGQLLNEGQYLIDIGGDGWVDMAESRVGCAFQPSRTGPVLRFEIEDNSTLSSKNYGQHGTPDVRWPGVLLMDLPWEQKALECRPADKRFCYS